MRLIVYVDMDDVQADFSSAHRRVRELDPGCEWPQSKAGFFEGLDPMEGAIEAMQALYESDRYSPFILTAPSCHNVLSYSEKRVWTERHLGFHFVDRLILCGHKNLLKGDLLIDDHIEGKGQEHFEGRLIHFGSERYPSWKEVMAELRV